MRARTTNEGWIDRAGAALATARRSGTVAGRAVDLRRIASLEEAHDVQDIAAQAYCDDQIGFALAGTSETTARLLHCDGPVVGPLFALDRLASGGVRAVSRSMMGIGAQFAFVFGRSFPRDEAEPIDPDSVGEAIACCRIALQVVARRVPHPVPLNDWTATADFGLAHTYVEGPNVEAWRHRLVGETGVALRMDGRIVAEGRADQVMRHPLAVAAWLVERVVRRGGCIEAGDIVATGSCTGLVQMTPGHVVRGDFGAFGSVDLRLE